MGFIEVMPQQKAGLRTEPPMSLPRPKGDIPDAIAEPSPPDDPPAVRSGCHGLRVRPCSGLSVLTRRPSSGRLVRPMGMAPAPRRRSTSGASVGAMSSAKAGRPWVVAVPDTSTFSLIVQGTPWRGPSSSPVATAASASIAAVLASSARTWVTAFNQPFTSLIRSRWALTTSRLDTSPAAIIWAKSLAVRFQRSSATAAT